jgi:hypothetical protein
MVHVLWPEFKLLMGENKVSKLIYHNFFFGNVSTIKYSLHYNVLY